MEAVNPYINFDGNTEEAFKFYQTVFGGELQIVRYKDMGDTMGANGEDLSKIANVALPLNDNTVLMGTDVLESMGQKLTAGNNFSITLETDSAEEAEKLGVDLASRLRDQGAQAILDEIFRTLRNQ